MEEEKKSVFVAFPAFAVHGDVMGDGVQDAFAESLEIPPLNIKVIEKDDNFYVFTDDLPIELHAANQTIVNAKQLNKSYEQSVLNLSKLVRRADAQINRSRELHSQIKTLKTQNEKLNTRLVELQNHLRQLQQKSNQVQTNMQKVVNNLA